MRSGSGTKSAIDNYRFGSSPMPDATSIPKQTTGNQLLAIGEAADMLGISVATLRMYEREGLILPYRRGSRHRRFSTVDIDRVRCMREMINKEKISIQGIRRMLSLIPCWKIKNCPEDVRALCPAFDQHNAPCWVMTEKPWECKNAECRLCPVYTKVANCASLKETIARFTTA